MLLSTSCPACIPLLLQSIYVDQLQILESDSSAPSPVPSATAGPAPSPVDVDPGIIGVALYVEGVEGIPILETQSGGTQLAVSTNVYLLMFFFSLLK